MNKKANVSLVAVDGRIYTGAFDNNITRFSFDKYSVEFVSIAGLEQFKLLEEISVSFA